MKIKDVQEWRGIAAANMNSYTTSVMFKVLFSGNIKAIVKRIMIDLNALASLHICLYDNVIRRGKSFR